MEQRDRRRELLVRLPSLDADVSYSRKPPPRTSVLPLSYPTAFAIKAAAPAPALAAPSVGVRAPSSSSSSSSSSFQCISFQCTVRPEAKAIHGREGGEGRACGASDACDPPPRPRRRGSRPQPTAQGSSPDVPPPPPPPPPPVRRLPLSADSEDEDTLQASICCTLASWCLSKVKFELMPKGSSWLPPSGESTSRLWKGWCCTKKKKLG